MIALQEEKKKNAKWGKTPQIHSLEMNEKSIVTKIVSADRLPSERFLVGYKVDDINKDFNKIYLNVSHQMDVQRIQRMSETAKNNTKHSTKSP